MTKMLRFDHSWIYKIIGLFGLFTALVGCPSRYTQLQDSQEPPGPEEKVYRLSVGSELQVPIEESEAMVYRFDAKITQDGLYRFETRGNVDTLCALVHGQKNKERFIIVRDVGGKGENCKLIWAFRPGIHRFKVRVDGRENYRVSLRKISWTQKVKLKLKRNEPTKNTIEKITERHQFRFTLPSPRLVQLQAKGNSLLQCILRQGNGTWYSSHHFRHPYGSCTIGRQLPAGTYIFELRSNRPRTKYQLQFQQVRMQGLSPGQLKEGFLRGNTFDVFKVELLEKKQHLIQTYGRYALTCTLEDRLGHIVVPHHLAPDKRNCLLTGQFPAGKYFLRIKLRKKKGGSYQVSFRQLSYQQLPSLVDKKIQPDFQSPFQLYRLDIPQARLYQIEIKGRPLHCSLKSKNSKVVPNMNLSEPNRCLLFANFSAGSYFLRVIPTTREEKPYHLRLTQYKPPKGQFLEEQQPQLVGPVYPGFKRVFKFTNKQPELLTLETRGSLDTVCSLYDASGSKLARDDDSGKRLNCQMTRYLKPGSYRLKIRIGGRSSGLFWVQRRRKKLPWVRLGKGIKATLKRKKQPHTFMLRVTQTGLYGFRTESKLDTICRLLDNDWKQVAKDDDSGEGKNCFLAQVLTPGIYSLQVRLYRSQLGSFRLFVNRLNLHQLQAGKPFSSNLNAPSWMTFYRIEIRKSGLFSFRTKGRLDTKCALLNERSKQISNNDDTNGQNKNCQIIENLQAGVYFFQVWLYKDKRKLSTGPFPYQALYEVKKANILTLQQGKYTKAKLSPGSITRFIFKATTNGLYRFETRSTLDPKCVLLDQSKRRVAKNDDGGQKRNCRINRRLQKGMYELQVRPATTNRNRGPYRVGVFKYGN